MAAQHRMEAMLRQCHHYTGFKVLSPHTYNHFGNRNIYHRIISSAFNSSLCIPHYHGDRVKITQCKGLSLTKRGVCEFHTVCKMSAMCHTTSHQTNIQHEKIILQKFSTNAHKVTLDTIFSESNKKRLQDNLLKTVKPSTPTQSSSTRSGHAAVLVPLCTVNGEPSLLFTLRSTSLRQHRGQVSFPGGKADETDRDVIHTALRETQEELGIAMETVDVWGTMMELPTRDKNLVTPVVGHCGEIDISTLTLSEDEVELVFTRTVKSLCDMRNVGHTQFRNGYTMPVFLGGEHRIWGLTSFILHQTLTNLAPGLYTYKLRYRS